MSALDLPATGSGASAEADTWHPVCELTRLVPGRGVAALIEDRAVAVFMLTDGTLRAIDNLDPASGASVMSRGLIGDADGTIYVASPMYKHRFDLSTGVCLDQPALVVSTHEARVDHEWVCVRVRS